ncbi:hypothetical protein BGZ63DRAFT_421239 [Mariannaea sp. PMI_226]|nr:hypothetical protein BGZ63DRAFT_421239 [Mariannaea sp. PMI_226]
MASSTVDREVSTSSGNGVTRPRASTNYSLFNHHPEPSNANIPPLRPRAKSSSNLGVRLEPKFEFDDHTLIDEDGNYKRNTGLADLIDFLKNHPPPADNFMSIPDGPKDEIRGPWAKFRKLTKRTKVPSKSPDPIRLPDSAVSGITTGGHRHISISIPLDASPFGRAPRSQYPVYPTPGKGGKVPASRYGPTRAVLNEKGVVTVLRTVNEDRESESPVEKRPSLRTRSSAPGSSRSRSRSRSSAGKSHSRAGSAHSNGRGKVSEYFGVSSSPPRAHSSDQSKRAKKSAQEIQDQDETQDQSQAQSSTAASQESKPDGSFPTRGSSLPVSRFVFPTKSIDAMMSEATTPVLETLPDQEEPQPQPISQETSTSSKTITTPTEPVPPLPEIKHTQEPSPLEEAPIIVPEKASADETGATVITNNPIPRGDGTSSPTPSIKSVKSQTRRQKVRDKRKRDLEAVRLAKRQSQYSEADTVSSENSKTEEPQAVDEATKSPGRKEKPAPLPLRSPSRQSLCAIMVVSDVQPSPPRLEASPEPEESTAEDSQPSQPSTEEPESATSATDQVDAQMAQLGLTSIVMSPQAIEPPLASPPLDHGFPKPPKVKPQFRPKPLSRPLSQASLTRARMSSPVASVNDASNPTPPASVKGSPADNLAGDRNSKQSTISVDRSSKQSSVDGADRSSKQSSIDLPSSKTSSIELPTGKRASMDYASISRRREWNTIREQDRRNRDSRLGSRSLPKPLVLPKEDPEEGKSPASERDVIRRYDVYREYRFREMERRVRRLERNGDIWLRTLVPVLENLNRTLSGSSGHAEPRERAQGWVSDEDFVGSLSPPRGRESFGFGNRRSRMMPRPGASEREFLEHLVRTKEELEAGNVSDETAGFESIEPLMRELAGRSRLSFEARSMALAEDDEVLYSGF